MKTSLLLHLYQVLIRGLMGNHTKRNKQWSTAAFHCCVNPAWLGEAALLEPGEVVPSLVTDKQQTTRSCQADTDTQTNSFTDTHTLQESDGVTCRHTHSGTKAVRKQTCEYNLSFLSPSISNTTTHMPVNGARSRAPSGTFSSPTHGVHHFLSNSPFPIVNTHLCTIRRASSRLTHIYIHTHKLSSLTHIQYT